MPGGGTLSVKSRPLKEGRWLVQIADTGPGIPEDDRERVFEPFYTAKEKGSGLGLSIVKSILDAHDGRIEIGSSPEGGNQDYDHHLGGSMETVLVVDDEKNYLLILEALLSKEGLQVLTAGSGLEALAVLRENEADLVLTDMKMPGLDGLELLSAIKDQEADLPVIVMTAYGTVDKAVEAMKRGGLRLPDQAF